LVINFFKSLELALAALTLHYPSIGHNSPASPIQVNVIAILNSTTLKARALETTPRERALRQADFPGVGTGPGISQTGRTGRRNAPDLAGACSDSKFVVPRTGAAYDARIRGQARFV